MNKYENIPCVILAGGRSSRMGTDKSFVNIQDEKTMLSVQTEKLKSISNNIWISANDEIYKSFGFPVISDIYNNIGPLGGIYSILKAIPDFSAFFISVDLPFVTKKLIIKLLDKIDEADIILPVHNENLEPTCAIYSKNCLSEIEKMVNNEDYKLMNLINNKNIKVKTIDVSDELNRFSYLFKNINTPQDLI